VDGRVAGRPFALARVVNPGALAEDSVSIRRVRVSDSSEKTVRRQLATVPVPATRRFVFVRRVILRARADQVGRAMTTALAQLAENSRSDMLAFADFPALVVACARAASTGGLGSGAGGGWHWRALGLSRTARLGEAVGALLSAYPLEAAAVTVALAANGLLAPVWSDLSESAAAQLTAALGVAGRFSPPNWPADGEATPADHGVAERYEPVLARATAFWSPVLRTLPHRHEAVRTAAALSLLRWSPMSLQAPAGSLWPLLLARIVGADAPIPQAAAPTLVESVPASAAPAEAPKVRTTRGPSSDRTERAATRGIAAPRRGPGSDRGAESSPSITGAPIAGARFLDVAARLEPRRHGASISSPSIAGAPIMGAPFPDAAMPIESRPHGEVVSTGWGGVLFLVNALNRLDIVPRLATCGLTAPSGWRVLLDIGLVFGMPSEEPLAEFLVAQDLEPPPSTGFCERILDDMQALYTPFEIWPPPLAQPARLLANETHLDLDLLTQRVDIDIRRAGLDIDPGWVPWLGRVVTFHYPNLTVVHLSGA
jgi:hypothetical protein